MPEPSVFDECHPSSQCFCNLSTYLGLDHGSLQVAVRALYINDITIYYNSVEEHIR